MAIGTGKLITPTLRTLLSLSSYFGLSPIHYDDSSGKFALRPQSSSAIICMVACLVRLLLTAQYASDFILGRPLATMSLQASVHVLISTMLDKERKSGVQKSIIAPLLKANHSCVVASHLFRTVVSWTRAKPLTVILNNWLSYEKELNSHAKLINVDEATRKCRKMAKVYKVILGTVAVLTFVIAVLSTWKEELRPGMSLAAVVSFLPSLIYVPTMITLMYTAELLDDVVILLLYATTSAGFDVVKSCVHTTAQMKQISKFEAAKWQQMTQRIQNQSRMLCSCLRLNEGFLLLQSIVMSTIFVFFISRTDWEGSSGLGARFHWCVYVFFLLARQFLKAWVAEEVKESEAKLSEQFAQVFSCTEDVAAAVHVKMLHDITRATPSRIRFGRVEYDRGIMLTILGTVVTYLIVLMQFSNN